MFEDVLQTTSSMSAARATVLLFPWQFLVGDNCQSQILDHRCDTLAVEALAVPDKKGKIAEAHGVGYPFDDIVLGFRRTAVAERDDRPDPALPHLGGASLFGHGNEGIHGNFAQSR